MAVLQTFFAGRGAKFANDPERWKRPCDSTVRVGTGASMGSTLNAHKGALAGAGTDMRKS